MAMLTRDSRQRALIVHLQVTAVDIYLSPTMLQGSDDEADGVERRDESTHIQQKRWNLNLPLQSAPGQYILKPEKFDVVHSWFVAEGIDDDRWTTYVRDLHCVTKKGGWVQMVELSPHVQSDNGRLSDDSLLTTWWLMYSQALTQMGKNVRIGRNLKRMLAEGGFDRVQECVYAIPIGDWKISTRQLRAEQSKSIQR